VAGDDRVRQLRGAAVHEDAGARVSRDRGVEELYVRTRLRRDAAARVAVEGRVADRYRRAALGDQTGAAVAGELGVVELEAAGDVDRGDGVRLGELDREVRDRYGCPGIDVDDVRRAAADARDARAGDDCRRGPGLRPADREVADLDLERLGDR